MPQAPMGRLESVDLRHAWQSESGDFTPWLAREENLKLLGETIGIELECEAQEKDVGPFRADILCKDTSNGTWVLIENQLEKTDHCHLGQLLTYAAGLDAVTIVWIARKFTEEHRAALDWLNRETSDHVNLFGLEIEVWRIGDSPAAPKFNIVAKPNEWTRTGPVSRTELTETRRLYLEYWTTFRQYLEDKGSSVRTGKPSPDSWTTFSLGRTGCYLSAVVSAWYKTMVVQLVLMGPDRLAHFHLLKQDQQAIEERLGSDLEWRELREKKESHIRRTFENRDPADRSQWPSMHEMMRQTLEAFQAEFRDRVKTLDAGDYVPAEDDGEIGAADPTQT